MQDEELGDFAEVAGTSVNKSRNASHTTTVVNNKNSTSTVVHRRKSECA